MGDLIGNLIGHMNGGKDQVIMYSQLACGILKHVLGLVIVNEHFIFSAPSVGLSCPVAGWL
jgi:hypothetical protein